MDYLAIEVIWPKIWIFFDFWTSGALRTSKCGGQNVNLKIENIYINDINVFKEIVKKSLNLIFLTIIVRFVF